MTSFENRKFVFTGTLQTFTRNQASSLVVALGGIVQNHLTIDTNILVLGMLGVDLFKLDKTSKKFDLAQTYQKKGADIKIINEQEFLALALQDLRKKTRII